MVSLCGVGLASCVFSLLVWFLCCVCSYYFLCAIGCVPVFLLFCRWFALFVSDGCVNVLLVRPKVFLDLLCF